MKEKDLKIDVSGQAEGKTEGRLSPIELIKIHGGKAHRVKEAVLRGADAMLAVYKGRFTYTFVMKKNVASIHYDEESNKIFFSGHNIQNMELSADQKQELYNVIKVLESDPEGKELKSSYKATLDSLFADNK